MASKKHYHSNLGGPHKKAGKKKAGKKKTAKKKSSKKKQYHSNLGGPHKKSSTTKTKRCKPCKPGTTRRPAKKAKASHGPNVTAATILKNVAVKRGKRWTCGGPVRSGCGGSNSRVIGKVR